MFGRSLKGRRIWGASSLGARESPQIVSDQFTHFQLGEQMMPPDFQFFLRPCIVDRTLPWTILFPCLQSIFEVQNNRQVCGRMYGIAGLSELCSFNLRDIKLDSRLHKNELSKGTSINDVLGFLAILDLHTSLPCPTL